MIELGEEGEDGAEDGTEVEVIGTSDAGDDGTDVGEGHATRKGPRHTATALVGKGHVVGLEVFFTEADDEPFGEGDILATWIGDAFDVDGGGHELTEDGVEVEVGDGGVDGHAGEAELDVATGLDLAEVEATLDAVHLSNILHGSRVENDVVGAGAQDGLPLVVVGEDGHGRRDSTTGEGGGAGGVGEAINADAADSGGNLGVGKGRTSSLVDDDDAEVGGRNSGVDLDRGGAGRAAIDGGTGDGDVAISGAGGELGTSEGPSARGVGEGRVGHKLAGGRLADTFKLHGAAGGDEATGGVQRALGSGGGLGAEGEAVDVLAELATAASSRIAGIAKVVGDTNTATKIADFVLATIGIAQADDANAHALRIRGGGDVVAVVGLVADGAAAAVAVDGATTCGLGLALVASAFTTNANAEGQSDEGGEQNARLRQCLKMHGESSEKVLMFLRRTAKAFGASSSKRSVQMPSL